MFVNRWILTTAIATLHFFLPPSECFSLHNAFHSKQILKSYGRGFQHSAKIIRRDSTVSSSSIPINEGGNVIVLKLKKILKAVSLSSPQSNIQRLSELHTMVMTELVNSDYQERDPGYENDLHRTKQLPDSYRAVIAYTQEMNSQLAQQSHPAAGMVKFIQKKEGFNKLVKEVVTDEEKFLTPKTLRSTREIIDIKRQVERTLSMTLTTLIAFRSIHSYCNSNQLDHFDAVKRKQYYDAQLQDLNFFGKVLIEKLPTHEKHFALLLLYRGIISTAFDFESTKHSTNVQGLFRHSHEAAVTAGIFSLRGDFNNRMKQNGLATPRISYRLVYPFAIAALRSYAASDIYQLQRRQYLRAQVAVQLDSESNIDFEERLFSQFLAACDEYDRECELQSRLTDQADEVVIGLRRWICDLLSIHFINEDTGAYSNRASLPERVRKNTIVMELLCTDKAYQFGLKKDRKRYDHAMIEIGRCVSLMSKLAIEQKHRSSGIEHESDLPVDLKKLMTVVSAVKSMPLASLARKKIEKMLDLSSVRTYQILPNAFTIRSNADHSKPLAADTETDSIGNGFGKTNRASVDDDDSLFWGSSPRRSSHGRSVTRKKRISSNMKTIRRISSSGMHKVEKLFNERSFDSRNSSNSVVVDYNIREFDSHDALLLVLAEQLNVPFEIMKSQEVSAEVDFVFSSWRRPYLLLKYLNMHATSQPMRQLFTQFMKALLSITPDTTVENIRYNHPGNRMHLKRFDPDIVEAWTAGQTDSGEYLPGFNDAQTFMMIGEDTHTCMTIRARQKATNRGLLSILLNGSCRVLGVKDSAGRLLSRSIVRLLVEEGSNRPVLYVDTPYGLSQDANHVEVYDQACELGRLLRLPVVYAKCPDAGIYVMSEHETGALPPVAERYCTVPSTSGIQSNLNSTTANTDIYAGTDDDSYYDNPEAEPRGAISERVDSLTAAVQMAVATAKSSISPIVDKRKLVKLLDYSQLTEYVWVNGVFDYHAHRFVKGHYPVLIPRGLDCWNTSEVSDLHLSGGESSADEKKGTAKPVVMAVRPIGAIERMPDWIREPYSNADLLQSESALQEQIVSPAERDEIEEGQDESSAGLMELLTAGLAPSTSNSRLRSTGSSNNKKYIEAKRKLMERTSVQTRQYRRQQQLFTENKSKKIEKLGSTEDSDSQSAVDDFDESYYDM